MGELDFYSYLIIAIFTLGYLMIAFEHLLLINKATSALLMGVLMWVTLFLHRGKAQHMESFGLHVSNIVQLVIFFVGILAIIQIMNSHQGFNLIARSLRFTSMPKMFWALGLLTFFLSSLLGSITCTIVMCTLLGQIAKQREDRRLFGVAVVLSANAGGAFSPIGDITTTMLWIGGQLSTFGMIRAIFLPSVTCMLFSLATCQFFLSKTFIRVDQPLIKEKIEPRNLFIFFVGGGLILLIPLFYLYTGLPAFMGVLLALAILWLLTDLLHRADAAKSHLLVPHILTKVDLTGPIFFLGVLLGIVAMEADGILEALAEFLRHTIGNMGWIAFGIGLTSAVVDNVPLVAAAIGMFSLETFPKDHYFWQLLAYAAGVGGSIFIFGSAPGVAYMALEEVDFFWYLKRASFPALIGYVGGFIVYAMTNI